MKFKEFISEGKSLDDFLVGGKGLELSIGDLKYLSTTDKKKLKTLMKKYKSFFIEEQRDDGFDYGPDFEIPPTLKVVFLGDVVKIGNDLDKNNFLNVSTLFQIPKNPKIKPNL